jgi:hypothetical protein
MLGFKTLPLSGSPVDNLAIPVCENADIHVDSEIREMIAKALSLKSFSGEKNQQVVLHDLLAGKVRALCVHWSGTCTMIWMPKRCGPLPEKRSRKLVQTSSRRSC